MKKMRIEDIGKIVLGVGALFVFVQFLATNALFIKVLDTSNWFTKFLGSLNVLLLGGQNNVEFYSLMSFLGFFWLALLGTAGVVVGYRMIRNEKLELWVYAMTIGLVFCILQYLLMLFTGCNAVFSVAESTAKTVRILQYFWPGFIGLPLVVAAYFMRKAAKRAYIKKHGTA